MDRWRIEKLVPGGEGLAHLPDGRVGFAPGALPGDLIRPTRLVSKKQLVRAEEWVLARPGPHRVAPPCRIAAACGGCDWMELERGAELEHKAGLLREALERTAKLRDIGPIGVVTAGPELGYRNRLRLHVDQQGRLGLFGRSSRDIVPVSVCKVVDPTVQRGLDQLCRAGERWRGKLGAFLEIELRSAELEPYLGIRLEPRATPLPAGIEPLLEELAATASLSVPGTERDNAVLQRWLLPGGVELRAPLATFTQINPAVNRALVSAVVDGARRRLVKSAADLYSGAGNFTLPLAAAGLDAVVGIEREGAAIRAAIDAARDQKLTRAEFVTGDVPRVLEGLVRRGRRVDLVVLDPPRGGARKSTSSIVALAPAHIALCSCDPVTLARDLTTLIEHGYRLDELTAFDMFPRTHHVEALVWLTKG